VAELIRYGAYLPKYRAPLGEIQSFEGRPGRPRAKGLATPGLDEDALTMAWEAAGRVLGDATPGAVVTLTHSAPFGFRKMSQTLARTLELDANVGCFDIAGHPGSLMDALELASALADSGRGQVLVVASDHVVSYDDRVCDLLSAGGAAAFLVGASGGFATLGEVVRDGREVYDIWRLGQEPEARYRLEVLFDAYGQAARGAFAKLERLTERPTAKYAAVCASQPHPQTLRALGRAGVTEPQLAATSFVGQIGNLGCASVGVALALGLDVARKGQAVAAFGYGGGEGIAQSIQLTATPPKSGTAAQIAGEPIDLGTYYRWTRRRQQEPH
jgi:hydroxymethylglutaryl-CoA synthase